MAYTDPDGLQYASGSLKNYDILLKCMLVGDSSVGKTCLLARFAGEHVNNSHISTIGIDFKMHTLDVDGVRVRVQLWDTAGHERYSSLTNQYYRRVNGIFLVYDITNAASFQNVRRWMDEISQNASQDVQVLLVGNKYDLARLRRVSRREGQTLAKECDVPYLETSALEGINIQQAGQRLCRAILKKMFNGGGIPEGYSTVGRNGNSAVTDTPDGGVVQLPTDGRQDDREDGTCPC